MSKDQGERMQVNSKVHTRKFILTEYAYKLQILIGPALIMYQIIIQVQTLNTMETRFKLLKTIRNCQIK